MSELKGGERGREGLVEVCTKRWVGAFFFFFVLTKGGWRKGKEGGVLSPDVRQRVEKQCVPKNAVCISSVYLQPTRRNHNIQDPATRPQHNGAETQVDPMRI